MKVQLRLQRFISWFALLILATTVLPQLHAQESVITLKTSKQKGESLLFYIKANGSLTIEGAKEKDPIAWKRVFELESEDGQVKIKGEVTEFYCNENSLVMLDVSKSPALKELYCSQNSLSILNVSENPALKVLHCSQNKLPKVDVSKNPVLEWLWCEGNQLTEINVSANQNLARLDCTNNQLSELDISKNTALKELYCAQNTFTSLEVSKNSALTFLDCADNKLTELNVSKNNVLEKLDCSHNQLSSLDVSENPALTELNCTSNQLTHLDASKNSALKELHCSHNKLSTLEVSKGNALTFLDCKNNQLTNLDVSKNTALKTLFCVGNYIKESTMDQLIASLPNRSQEINKGKFYVFDDRIDGEQNICTTVQVTAAKELGWNVLAYSKEKKSWEEYPGSTATNTPQLDDPKLLIYPNPAGEVAYIRNAQSHVQAILHGMDGTILFQTKTNAQGEAELSTSSLPVGNYLLRIGSSHTKLVISR